MPLGRHGTFEDILHPTPVFCSKIVSEAITGSNLQAGRRLEYCLGPSRIAQISLATGSHGESFEFSKPALWSISSKSDGT